MLSTLTQSLQAETRLLQQLQAVGAEGGAEAERLTANMLQFNSSDPFAAMQLSPHDLRQALTVLAPEQMGESEAALEDANHMLSMLLTRDEPGPPLAVLAAPVSTEETPDLLPGVGETPAQCDAFALDAAPAAAADGLSEPPSERLFEQPGDVGRPKTPVSWVETRPVPEDVAFGDTYLQVVLSRDAPHPVVWASAAWRRLYTGGHLVGTSEISGKELSQLLHGPQTEEGKAEELAAALVSEETSSVTMTSHTEQGRPFQHTMLVERLRDAEGNVQCLQITSNDVKFGANYKPPPASAEAVRALQLEKAAAIAASRAAGAATDINADISASDIILFMS